MPRIGPIELPDFPLLLAPMEDVSDPPFRIICKELGADVVYECSGAGPAAQQLLKLVRRRGRYAQIGDVRGLGAMIAVEFVKNFDPQQPDAATCQALLQACADRGLVLISAGTHGNIIRILCPLVISDELLNAGLDIMEQELQKILG